MNTTFFRYIKEGGPLLWAALLWLLFTAFQQIEHYSHPTYQKYKFLSLTVINVDSVNVHKEIRRTFDSVYTYNTATDKLLKAELVKKNTVIIHN